MYKGYKLIQEKHIKDVNSDCVLLEHEKTGAKVFLMKNDDDNKTFGIGFKTLPKDNTGICHIIEHSVLSGSRKFQTKEPFMDMVKISMATFLNALTFPDKTIYPVSSRNEKDFKNLMDVYMDAVFYPVMKKDRRIFMQEGWHYELENAEDELNIKGVVYNEMKGAYSVPETTLYYRVNNALCPDTVYAMESGGEPYEIPNLTYENFCDFHSKYYHPSNSYIYLYGDCDMEERLEFLDREYLSNFEKEKIDNFEGNQKPFENTKNVFDEYSVSKDEDTKNKTFLAYSSCFGESNGLKDGIIEKLLSEILVDMQGAYLKEALLKANICEDVSSISMESTKFSSFGVYVINSEREYLDKFKEIVENVLREVVKNGIGKEKLIAVLNRTEFSIRELLNSTTAGVEYFFSIFDTWLYGGSPMDSLTFDEALSEIREDILNNRLLERVIEEKILNNNHKAFIVLSPSAGLNDKKDLAQKEWLKRYKDSLSQIQIEKIIENTKNLIEYQQTESTEEQKATIPKLKIEDIDKETLKIPNEVEKIEDITVLKHNIFTSGINYVDICFDLKHISKDEIVYLSLVENLLKSLDKKSMTYKDFSVETFLRCGGVSTAITTLTNAKNREKFVPKFVVSVKFLGEKLKETVELLKVLLKETIFTDKSRIKEEVLSIKGELEQDVLGAGHMYGINRAKSYFSNKACYDERFKGLDYLKFIQDLAENFDDRIDNVLEKMEFVYNRMFKQNETIVNITTTEENFEEIKKAFVECVKEFPRFEDISYDFTFERENLKEAIATSSDVNYVTFAGDLKKLGIEYSGSFSLLSKILSTTHMHNNIRAIGGAYGAGLSITRDSEMLMFSYRDPNLKSTKETFNSVGKYVSEMEITEEELESFKISLVKDFNPLLTPKHKGYTSMVMYITGSDEKELELYLGQLLNTKLEDLRELGKVIDEVLSQDGFVVVGNTNKIKENSKEFKNIVVLKK
ncbi:insulinase family protein [Parvimonas parva]|uniref:Insulinase family protein n=1 Tax=Parvimonas parva TaxID=2769485 RepID=A0ABS1C8U7_9FIRM|nr:insulinase family protein [Parvimonas parva]MBK1468532.1 insulinase family protein [Parvimonas parva]